MAELSWTKITVWMNKYHTLLSYQPWNTHPLSVSFSKSHCLSLCECICLVQCTYLCYSSLFFLFSLPSTWLSLQFTNPVFFSLSLLFFFLSSVVYEHRSRLEKSLQKERLEHKKAKEGEKKHTYAQFWLLKGISAVKGAAGNSSYSQTSGGRTNISVKVYCNDEYLPTTCSITQV